MATPKGYLHSVFLSTVDDLVASGTAAAAPLSGGQRGSLRVAGLESDPSDPHALTEPFDRSEIGRNYGEVRLDASDPGTEADESALKIQNDYVAAREAALRAALASPVRRHLHAMARRRGHGNPAGVFENGVKRFVQDRLREGGS